MNYNYDVAIEGFKREDNRGRPLYVNITEAQRIVSLLDLGNTVAQIENKMSLSSPLGTSTTIKNFIRNYKDGNIDIPTDAPAPVKVFNDLEDDSRVDALEIRVKKLEDRVSSLEEMMDNKVEKPSWKKRLGL